VLNKAKNACNKKATTKKPTPKICPLEGGFCVLSNGADQNSGVVKLDSINGNNGKAKNACLQKCLKYNKKKATGCEVIWDQSNRGCYVHTASVHKGNKVARHSCWIFSKCKA